MAKKRNFKKALTAGCELSLRLLHNNLVGNDIIALTQSQLNRLKRAYETNNHSSYHKTRVYNLSCGIRMWAQLSFLLAQIKSLTDGRSPTERRTNFSSLDRVCIPRSAVKL